MPCLCLEVGLVTLVSLLNHAVVYATADASFKVAPRAYSTGHYTTFSLSTEDRLEILDLCHKFDNLLNMGRQDKLGELFAPDAQVSHNTKLLLSVAAY